MESYFLHPLKLFAQTLERGSKKGVQNLQLANVGGVYVPYKSGAGLALFENLLQQGKVDEAQKLLDLALYAKRIGIYDRFENLLTQPQKLETILQLYPSFLPILNYTKSFEDVYLWYQLADEDPKKFQKIVDLELYKYLDPKKVDKQVVNYLLKFGDFGTVKLIAENVPAEVLKELTSIEPYKLEKFAETYGVKGLICLTDYVKIKPTIAQEIVNLSEKDPKVVYFLCRPEVKEYLSKYPAEFEDIVSAYEDQKGLIGKIKLLLLGSMGSYSEDVIKLTNPKLYKLVWVIRLILVFILLGVIWKIYSFVRGLFSFRKGTSTTEVHYIREETKPVHVKKNTPPGFLYGWKFPLRGSNGETTL